MALERRDALKVRRLAPTPDASRPVKAARREQLATRRPTDGTYRSPVASFQHRHAHPFVTCCLWSLYNYYSNQLRPTSDFLTSIRIRI